MISHLSLTAANRYWVGGTGSWNDPAHWSATSGGQSGASIPGISDDVFFDENSFSMAKQTVMLPQNGICHNLDWSRIDKQVIFSGGASRELRVNGSCLLSQHLLYGFKGKIIFNTSGLNNTIKSSGVKLLGEWVFDGTGSWLLDDEINGDLLTINHLKGSLNTNDQKVTCYDFKGNSSTSRILNLGLSEVYIKNIWDFSSATNLTFNSSGSRIIFDRSTNSNNFRSGGLSYGSVSAMAAACSPSGQPCAGFTITLTATNVTCFGLANGNVVANITGGSGNFTYNWNGAANPAGEGTDSIFNLSNGNYNVRIDDLTAGTFCFCNINVLEPSLLFDYELYQIEPLCFGQNNGSFAVDATGGTFPYTYSWSGGLGTNDTVFAAGAGTYTATVTDVNGCTASIPVTLNQPTQLLTPGISTNITCNSLCNGTATVNPSGGTTPYLFDWGVGTPTGDGTNAITNLCAGNYSVTVTDDNGCTSVFNATITQPPVLTLALSKVNASCGGTCDASVTATVTGGTSQYTYAWSPSGGTTTTALTSNTISSLCAGKYIVLLTDANGCTKTDSIIVTEPDTLIAVGVSGATSCNGVCDGTASVTVTGGSPAYNYNWNGSPTGDLTPNASGLCPGSYTVTVSDINGCSDTALAMITEPALLFGTLSSTNVLCAGTSTGTASVVAQGGTQPYTYNWTPLNPTGDGTPNITNLAAGNYCVAITDQNGCDTTQCIIITQPPALTLTIVRTNVNCTGACDGTATVTAAGGTPPYNYSWAGTLPTPQPYVGQGTNAITNLCPGSFTVTVTDANGCVRTISTTITQPNVLNASFILTGAVLACNGDCTATIGSNVSGGTPPYTFSWTGVTSGPTNGPSVSNQCAGPYSLTVTDDEGCVRVINTTIIQPTLLVVTPSSTNINCFGVCNGTASALGSGGTPGYTYSWSGGQIGNNINSLCAGTYTVTVKDQNNCTSTGTATVTSPPQLVGDPTVINDVLCSGQCNGSIYSNATGGIPPYNYNWFPNPVIDGNDTAVGLCAGSYSLLLTDANGCTSNESVTVTQPTPLGAPITGQTSSCNVCNGSATVTPTGGTPPYTFLWNDPADQTTATATGLCPNTVYSVTVIDANGCVAASTVTIAQTITIQITTSNTTLSCADSCDGVATANPSGGQMPYNYLWVGPNGTVTTVAGGTAFSLCAGSYTVTVVDANGCLNRDSVTFTEPPAILLNTSSTNATCGGVCNGTATGVGSGGTGALTYSWNTSPAQPTANASGLCAGTYTLTVTDGNGCTDTSSVIITEPTPVIDNPVFTDANCLTANGTIIVAPTGGNNTYAYNWGPGVITGQGTPTVTGLLAGTYTLDITSGGCVFNFSYLVNNINGPTLVMSHANASCNGVCDGTASVVASGGAPGYTYDWNGAATPLGDLSAGITALCGTQTYSVQVTDAAGCISIDTATVINPDPISPNEVVTNESCGTLCDGSIVLAPTGGSGTYNYSWSSSIPGLVLPPNSSQNGLCAGTYSVTILDVNGCDTSLTINITAPPTLMVSLASTNVLCFGACNGTATATITGGAGVDTIIWTNQPPSIILPNIVGLCPNQYIVTVVDVNGCIAKDTVDITEPTPLITSTSFVDASCNATCDGIGVVNASGGTPGYNYAWSPGVLVNNDTASGLCAGVYNVTVSDANGCTSTPPSIIISEPTLIVANITSTNPLCNGACDGTATSAASGGTGPYTYDWSPNPIIGDGTSSVSGLCAGNYSVIISDAMGCSRTQNFTLANPPALNTAFTTVDPTCQNSCNGTATALPSGGTPGYTYLWSPGGATTATAINLCPITYVLVVTDTNNCKDTVNVAITNPSAINIAVSSTPAACGVCDGTMTINPITGTPSYTYAWSSTSSPGTVFPATSSQTGLCADLYNVTVTDANGCDSTFALALNNSGGPTGEVVTANDATCPGVCNGSGSVVPVGGVAPYLFEWLPATTPPTFNDTALNLCAGNYFVEITDSNTCIHFAPVTIGEPAPILSNATVTSAICSNVCNGVISLAVSGGTSGYSYAWTGPAGPIAGNTSVVSGLCSGTYTVTITDFNGCTKVDSFVVNQSTPLTVAASATNISCSNTCSGMAYVTISSGTPPFNIQWNDPSGQTNDTAVSLCAGVYTATITDFNGCITTASVTILSTPAVAINATVTSANCGVCDGAAIAAPTGGTAPYTLLWSNGQSGLNATDLCAGLYTVNVTDSAGCVSSFGVPVSNTNGPTSLAITSTNIACNNQNTGAVTGVTPTGGTAPYTYLWIQGGQTTPTLNGLSAGPYYVEVTDANGCSITDSVLITEASPIIANQVVNAATCGMSDGSITVSASGGSGTYTYLWNTGPVTPTISNLSAGVYSVQITDVVTGCVKNVVIPVNNFNGPAITMSSTNVSCNAACNGTATVTPGGLTSYLWNDVSAQTTAVATGLCPGDYAVVVTGSNGCSSVGTVTITEPPVIGFSIANAVNPFCNGDTTGSITVVPSGGTLSYSYAWTPSGGSSSTASNLSAGSYTVTVTDALGCTATQSTTLTQTNALTIGSVITNPSCSSLSDGSIDVTVSGGTTTYTYQWSVGSAATTEDLSNIAAGTYIIDVTDGNGCTIADTSILVPLQSVFVSAGNDTTFCQNGSITLSATSTTATSYQWFDLAGNSAGNTSSVSVTPPAGSSTYYVIADNGTGCTANDTIILTSNVLPQVNAGTDVTIVVGASTTIGGNPTTASGNSILWNPLPGLDNATVANPVATPPVTTTYVVTVTTLEGCTASDSVVVTVLPTIIIPDGISPNADGDNDEWIIDGIELFPNCVVEVYNRWGELLFQSVGYKERWKGTYKGKDLPVGSYYYVIDLKDEKFPDVYTGPITILR
ncbi:MAG: hypothetical protein K0Q95_1693 [Bacteroidota bacterium]|nr:hypothetical protein [Bacteroidota bacterium]